MFKLPHNCTHFTGQNGNAQNPSSQASTICESRTSKCASWIQKRQRNQRSTANIQQIIEKAREFHKNIYSSSLTKLKPLAIKITTNWKILKEMGILNHLTCLLRTVCWSRSSSQNQTTNQFKMWERATSRLYIVTLLIQFICIEHHAKCWAR